MDENNNTTPETVEETPVVAEPAAEQAVVETEAAAEVVDEAPQS